MLVYNIIERLYSRRGYAMLWNGNVIKIHLSDWNFSQLQVLHGLWMGMVECLCLLGTIVEISCSAFESYYHRHSSFLCKCVPILNLAFYKVRTCQSSPYEVLVRYCRSDACCFISSTSFRFFYVFDWFTFQLGAIVQCFVALKHNFPRKNDDMRNAKSVTHTSRSYNFIVHGER